MKTAIADNNKSPPVQQPLGHGHILTLQGKQLSEVVEAYGRQEDAMSPC